MVVCVIKFLVVVVQLYSCIFYATVGFNEELNSFVSIKLSCIFVSGSNHPSNRLFYLFSHILQQALEIFRLLYSLKLYKIYQKK